MSDKVFLSADKCCLVLVQEIILTCVLDALVDFGCDINCCAELHVSKDMNSV